MTRFPDPRYVHGDIVALGEDLSVDTLRDAYRHGIFPWQHEGLPLPWFSPRRRTILFWRVAHPAAGRWRDPAPLAQRGFGHAHQLALGSVSGGRGWKSFALFTSYTLWKRRNDSRETREGP